MFSETSSTFEIGEFVSMDGNSPVLVDLNTREMSKEHLIH